MAEQPQRFTIGGELETTRSEKAVWLMKFPSSVSRAFSSQSASDAPSPAVAKVVFSIDPLLEDASASQFTMELAGNDIGNVPKCYSLNMCKDDDLIPMSVFSQTDQGKVSVEGKVLHKFDMKPHDEYIKNYSKLCRERTNKYKVKSRQLQVIIDNDRPMRPLSSTVGLIAVSNKDKKKATTTKGSDTKRTRRDPAEMESIMFKLFERQPNWTLRQLIQETDQPEQFLKDMLKLLCVYNNKGTNQGTYELKPEYKKSNEMSA